MKKIMLTITIVFIIGLFVYLISAMFEMTKTNKELVQKLSTQTPTSPTSAPNLTPTPTTDDHLLDFEDLNLEALRIPYDSTLWTVTQLKAGETVKKNGINYTGPAVLFENAKDNGVLALQYTLAFGVGGGMTPFSNQQITKLANSWIRFTDGAHSSYGNIKDALFFDENPKEKQAVQEYCDKLLSGSGDDLYPIYDKSQCTDFKNGIIIGHLRQPAFSRSPRFKRVSSLKTINPTWAVDEYVQKENMDDGYVIVMVSYQGSNPQSTDTLVQHLKPW